MSLNRYTVGDMVQVSEVISDVVTGDPVDPTVVTLIVRKPDGDNIDFSEFIVHDAVGQYHADYLVDQVGLYQYEWIGTGAVDTATVGKFLVDQGPL